MAQVTVQFEDYQAGSLPGVCVFTGLPTADHMVLRTRIIERDPAAKPPGPVLSLLSQVSLIENPRSPRNTLVGRLPVDADHLARRQRHEGFLRMSGWAGLALLVVAAVNAQPWSPVLAVGSIAWIVVSTYRRAEFRRNRPTPTLIGAGSRVHLADVHQDFVKAVEAEE